ncbi:bifunctional 4-hydroxy-2-oxoglutarate aldolase/2-dehydro-3-deoxy-phosphogluconate aldolase [uncultured Veillonella sp.]|uniref:bifunctional 4-hydroxy-2-oxoglutarate aldolase/2-dehydro-3-deoxy-phosphogluconate aldolase n=1 Tax=uncultured Veillonella sp. TaxID=159268 RepID=UPI0025F84828|nr:bifunctional 4-hydroxy-2-oxoglutarate aldolase/2-dehydro-3-deoxy-phosphogluconate aldolase [uncultured Veillonella sp.]MDY3974301.1 bifunctional 4-hydroxy-2-oxoglutarate aldolase/2-dehydro-3-deoxy-phosphogluconate aldolase [Veillonella caviae]
MKVQDLSPVTVILRGYGYDVVRNVCEAILPSKYIKNIEITMNTEGAIECIEKICAQYGNRLNVGAGTVTTLEQAKASIEAGAQFLLAPVVLSKEIIDYAKSKGVVTVSGAYSPTEIWQALQNGSDVIKVFPISNVCDTYFKDVKAPLGEFPLMAVGGVKLSNAKELLQRGASHLGLGGVFSKDVLKANDLEAMKKEALAFDQVVEEALK